MSNTEAIDTAAKVGSISILERIIAQDPEAFPSKEATEVGLRNSFYIEYFRLYQRLEMSAPKILRQLKEFQAL
jgi:hypothetical protein